jgi:hypothetical protein
VEKKFFLFLLFIFSNFKATHDVCNDDTCEKVCGDEIGCDSDYGLTCVSDHCVCILPYQWNEVTKRCDSCASGYLESLDENGERTCRKNNFFQVFFLIHLVLFS